MGGALGTVRDKIFVATGSEVRGFTKKGKMFLQFETNLAEKIGSMYISGSHLFVCGNYVFNHYNDCRDANYLLASDRINDVLSLPIEKTKVMTPVLACADRSLRVVRDSEVRLVWFPNPLAFQSQMGTLSSPQQNLKSTHRCHSFYWTQVRS